MGDASTNGDLPHSVTLEHVTSYPIVHDLIEYIKNNPYAQTPINLTDAAFQKLVKPTFPYLETPASYAKPYALKIDEYGNIFLDKIDEKVPVLKSETKEVKSTVIAYINWPVEKYTSTYNEQYKKCGGDGYIAGGKALITTGITLTAETLGWLTTFLQQKTAEAKNYVKEAEKGVRDYASKAEKEGREYISKAEKEGKEFASNAEKTVKGYAKDAQKQAQDVQKQVQDKANE